MKIFINYRRDDEANIVFAIANALMKKFGVENVFFDKQAIRAGSDFSHVIDKALENCRVFIPVIGRKWVDSMNKRRALDENDYVLNEIEHAMGKGVFILPVLVDDTPMPSEKDLPTTLKGISFLNAVNISSDPKHLPSDIKLLTVELKDIFSRIPKRLKPKSGAVSKKRVLKIAGWIFGVLLSVSVVVILATTYVRNHSVEQDSSMSEAEENQLADIVEVEKTYQAQTEPEKVKTSKAADNQVVDIDGNIYSTVVIGDQEWMAENLKVTHYTNGDPIQKVSDDYDLDYNWSKPEDFPVILFFPIFIVWA